MPERNSGDKMEFLRRFGFNDDETILVIKLRDEYLPHPLSELYLMSLLLSILNMSRSNLRNFLLNSCFLPIANNDISKDRSDLFKIQALSLRHEGQIEESADDTRYDEDDIVPSSIH